jgi:hypothetical protein
VVILIINSPLGIGKTTTAWYLLEKFPIGVMLDGDYIAALHPVDHYDPTHLDYAYHTFRVLMAHQLAHGIRDFVLNGVFEPTFRKPHGIFMNKMPHSGAPGVAAVVGADRSP